MKIEQLRFGLLHNQITVIVIVHRSFIIRNIKAYHFMITIPLVYRVYFCLTKELKRKCVYQAWIIYFIGYNFYRLPLKLYFIHSDLY